jgi:hypothetical protein
LTDLIARSLPIEDAIEIARNAAAALSHTHTHLLDEARDALREAERRGG